MMVQQLTAQPEMPANAQKGGHLAADQREVAAFLTTPSTYGLDVHRVERIDTHGAMVFLAGARAYKLKRAVHYPYMDFSTLALRHAACKREVALNRRTAPELYLGIKPVVRRSDGHLSLSGAGEIVEWVVVMKRFAQEGLCDRLAQAGKLTPELMRALADEIAAFHDTVEPLSGPAAAGGGAAGLRAVIEENAAELNERPDLFPTIEAAAFNEAAQAALERIAPLLDQRLAEGFVRRCHGDLHLKNICVIEERPTIFDAIEFNETISCIDLLYDLAFLLMDLDHRGLRPYANLVLNRYLQRHGNLTGLAALPLFLSTRAAVRAKISVSMAESQISATETDCLYDEARAYFHAARAYLEPALPRLVAIGGLSGAGKTSLARELAPNIGASPGALHLRSDVVRKTRLGLSEFTRLAPEAYTPDESDAVYDELTRRARAGLSAGRAVIADAVYARAEERRAIEAVARELGVPFTGFWLEAPAQDLFDRVAVRKGDASDATPTVVRRQLTYELGDITWRRLNAATPLATIAAKATHILAD